MIYRQEASQHWPSAPGQILFITHRLRGGTSVHYAYEVDGQYVESSTDLLPHIKRAQLKTGNRIPVRYDPANPKVSVLDPGFSLASVFEILFGAFFLMWSVIMGALSVSSYRNPKNTKWTFSLLGKGKRHAES
jgi:hypothetical protein